MYNKRFLLIAIIFSLFVTSCSSLTKQKLIPEEEPRFDGRVSPITIPIQPEYKPANCKLNLALMIETEDESKSYFMDGSYDVKRLGESLIWEVKIIKVKRGARSTTGRLPVIDSRLLTSKFGEIKEVEISLPTLDKNDLDEEKREKVYENTKILVKKLPQTLPQSPVKSGDILIRLAESEYFMEILERLAPKHSLVIKEVNKLRNINLILQGWCYYGDRKAVLSTANESLKLTVSVNDPAENGEAILELKFIGYAIHDSVTFQPLKMELLLHAVVFDKSSGESSEASKVFISQNAELKKL